MISPGSPLGESNLAEFNHRLALVVGVNNSVRSHYLADLRYAENDALEMARILQSPACNFELLKPALTGDQANTSFIKQALLELARKRSEKDFLLFYFSGHAQPVKMEEGLDDIYFVTNDFSEEEVLIDPSTHISMRWLRNILYSTEANVLIILDCSYAGNMIHTGQYSEDINLSKLIEDSSNSTDIFQNKDRSWFVLAATGNNALAQEKEGHGLMTGLLIRALQGEIQEAFNLEGQIGVQSLHKYLMASAQEEQSSPTLIGEAGIHSYMLAQYPRITDPNYFRKLTETRHEQPLDHETCTQATFADLDIQEITQFLGLERVQRQEDFRPEIGDEEQLSQFGLLSNSHPTYGAILCLGYNPSQWVSGAITRCIHWRGNDRSGGWLDDQEYRGSLKRQFESSCNFLRKYLCSSQVISSKGKSENWEIPFIALRETLVNALVHREYTNRTDWVQVEVFGNRVEISSPGDLPALMTLDLLKEGHLSFPRNPQIARIFYLYGYVENFGAGIRRMQRAIIESELPPPQFMLSETKRLIVTLYRPKQAEKRFIIYSILLAASPDLVVMGEKLEVAIYLSPAKIDADNEYLLQISRDEAAKSELNMFLRAPGFHIDGKNTASIPFGLYSNEDAIPESDATQVARFNLIALRSGSAQITLELYRGSSFEVNLNTEVSVTQADAVVFPKLRIAIHPRPVLQPDLMLQVSTDWNEIESTCAFRFSFTSLSASLLSANGADYRSDFLPGRWVEQTHTWLKILLEESIGSLPEDVHTRLISFGQYLFQQTFPPELQRVFRYLAQFKRMFSLLLLAEQSAWLPWELLHDGQAFLGERFIVGRWPRELADTCPYEFPVGIVNIAHYANVPNSLAETWATLFESRVGPPPKILPGGLFDSLISTEEMRGLYLMRLGSSLVQNDLQDAPAQYNEINYSNNFVDREIQSAKLSLRRNKPLVGLGYISAGRPELTALEQTWAPAFIHAGCSALLGPLWAVQQPVEAAFVSGFYHRLWTGGSLGEAFNAGRKLARIAVPESLDWLAYVLFGDPMARPYRPMKGQGYAVIEPIGREIDDPLPAGSAARFRVSLRRIPPIWHEERVIEVTEDLIFENLEVTIIASGLQVTPSSPLRLIRTPEGDYLGWFTLVVPIEETNKRYIVQVHFMDGIEPIHRLRFSLKVGKQGGKQL